MLIDKIAGRGCFCRVFGRGRLPDLYGLRFAVNLRSFKNRPW